MTQAEYENHKKRLDAERRAALELIEASYQTQLRALELVRLGSPQELSAGSALPSPVLPAAVSAPPVAAPVRLGQVHADVVRIYWNLPEIFDRNDVRRALGYDPPRNSLSRVLSELVATGNLRIARVGMGRGATRYARSVPAPAAPSPTDA